MAKTILRNIAATPVTVPHPYNTLLAPGESIVVDGDSNAVVESLRAKDLGEVLNVVAANDSTEADAGFGSVESTFGDIVDDAQDGDTMDYGKFYIYSPVGLGETLRLPLCGDKQEKILVKNIGGEILTVTRSGSDTVDRDDMDYAVTPDGVVRFQSQSGADNWEIW